MQKHEFFKRKYRRNGRIILRGSGDANERALRARFGGVSVRKLGVKKIAAREQRKIAAELQNGLDFSVYRDVGCGFSIDRKSAAVSFFKMEKPADVVILVVQRKQSLGLGIRQAKCRQRHRGAELTSDCAVLFDQFPQ
jgi:hypothetical protein